jgi:hypothetical protein
MKFSIRDLFLLTVIVALAVGWGMDRWRLRKYANAAEDAEFLAGALVNDIGHDNLPRLRELCKKYGVDTSDASIHLRDLPSASARAPNSPKIP